MPYKITSLVTGETITTDYIYDETFARFFPCCRDDAAEAAFDALIEAVDDGRYAGGYENFLGIHVERTDYDPMGDMLFDPDEMDTITELDSDDFGTLYSVRMEHIGLTIAVYVTDDGEELYTSDWWAPQPRTVKDMADHEWITGDELAN